MIIKNNQYWELYRTYIPDLKVVGKEWRGSCPFHKEKTPGAFSISGETGQYFCHSCGKKGNAITFARFVGQDEFQFLSNNYRPVRNIGAEQVDRFHKSFKNLYSELPYNWDNEIVDVLNIGYDAKTDNLVFPIYDENKKIINVKWHKGRQISGSKATLYPLNLVWNYHSNYIVIAEGEKDAITLLSNKIQALTGTGGALTVPKDLSVLNKFLNVYICFDNDNTGIAGAEKWADEIKKLKKPKLVRIADVGKYVTKGGDVTNYFNNPFSNKSSFCREVLDKSKYYQPFTDIPNFLRKVLLSDKFKELTMRDQNVFTTLVMRASRFFTRTVKINGKSITIKPGEYLTSIKRLQAVCAKDITEKQVRSALESLQEKDFIRSTDLKAKRGRLITLIGWDDENRQPKRQENNGIKYVRKYPFLRGGDASE